MATATACRAHTPSALLNGGQEYAHMLQHPVSIATCSLTPGHASVWAVKRRTVVALFDGVVAPRTWLAARQQAAARRTWPPKRHCTRTGQPPSGARTAVAAPPRHAAPPPAAPPQAAQHAAATLPARTAPCAVGMTREGCWLPYEQTSGQPSPAAPRAQHSTRRWRRAPKQHPVQLGATLQRGYQGMAMQSHAAVAHNLSTQADCVPS
jgi:hypothetical protein